METNDLSEKEIKELKKHQLTRKQVLQQNNDFLKAGIKTLELVYKYLSSSQLHVGVWIILQSVKNHGTIVGSQSHIAKVTGSSRRTVHKAIEKLSMLNIIQSHVNYITVSPSLSFKGHSAKAKQLYMLQTNRIFHNDKNF